MNNNNKQKAYHTPTLKHFLKKEKELFKISNGWYFGGKDSCLETWEKYKENTCIRIDEDGNMVYADLDYYTEKGYEIIEPEKTWDNLEVGVDVLIDKKGNEHAFLGALHSIIYYAFPDDDRTLQNSATIHSLEQAGWSIKQPKEEVQEMTDEEKEAIQLLKSKGFKIVKE